MQGTIYQFITIKSILLIAILYLTSCSGNNCDELEAYATINVKLEVSRIEDELLALESSEEALELLSDHPMLANQFWHAGQYPNDTILSRRLFRLFQEPSIDTLIIETKEYFSDFETNIDELQRAFRFVKYHYPKTKIPRIETVITGFYNDMYISDSLIILGLDYFVGVNGRFQPNDIPNYIVRRYKKESLAPIVMSFVSNEFNQPDQQHGTLLADMVNLGKSYYFVKQALPCKADSLIIGYSAEEMKLVLENQEVIWANLIENELLYETSHFLKNKFVGESPNVAEISDKCPGRIGAWIGWEIVKKYMEKNADVSMTDLMKEKDAHMIFQKSGYKPRNVKK
jgi:gliding motility-associated lipoprotein GldB